MTRTRRTLQKLERMATRPAEIPMSLEAAFAAIEGRASHADGETPDRTETRASVRTSAQEQR